MNDENKLRTGQADHLMPWTFKPGQSGNPRGRPKGAKDGPRVKLRRCLEKKAPAEVVELFRKSGITLADGVDMADVVVEVLCRKAMKGEDAAIKLIFDQLESPMPKQLEVQGNPDRPINVNSTPSGKARGRVIWTDFPASSPEGELAPMASKSWSSSGAAASSSA